MPTDLSSEIVRFAFEALLAIANLGIGFVLVTVRTTLTELRSADTELRDKVTAIEVLVAANYLTRVEFQASIKTQTDTILRAVDRQQTQIDSKQDRGR